MKSTEDLVANLVKKIIQEYKKIGFIVSSIDFYSYFGKDGMLHYAIYVDLKNPYLIQNSKENQNDKENFYS